VKKLFALFLLFSCLYGKAQNTLTHSRLTNTHSDDGEKPLFNWYTFIDAFSQKLNIEPQQANGFFSYAQNKGLVDMADYRSKIKSKIVTSDNALQHWLNNIPYYENLYKNTYLPYLETKKVSTSSQKNNTPNSPMASCNNLDFSSGTANWQGQWSNIPNSGGVNAYGSMNVNGLNSSGVNSTFYVHEICTPGTDGNVPINTVPPGHTTSLRLGNDSAYKMNVIQTQLGNSVFFPYNHQKISNTFLVTQANKTITYWYAVALSQSATTPHIQTEQPFFKIRMYDQSGNEIVCARYDVDATTSSTIGGFQSVIDPTGNNQFMYKDWSQVVIPLLNYVGQNVTLTFETCDCALGGHFGYAYIATDCAPFPGITFTPFTCGMTTTVLTAPPGVATYSWTGSGIVGSHTNQTVTVNAGGTFSVTMTTLGNGGVNCTLSLDTFLQGVPPVPVATFSTLPVCVGNPTVFGGVTPGVYNHIMWDFGDGIKDSVNTAPTHTYAAPGTYTVSLLLNNGCSDTYTAIVTVSPGAISSFNAAPVCKGTSTVFNNTSTGGTSYSWNFGNGSPLSSIQNPTYTYPTSGVFAVTLTVTNTAGCKFVTTNSVTVNVMPLAQFSAQVACLGVATVFNNTSTPNTNINYHWDFGDPSTTGDTSNLQSPTYTYGSIGTYTVSLQVLTTAGCSSAVNYTVIVNPIPAIQLVTPPPYCWGDHVPQTTYTVNPNNPALTYAWNNTNTQIGLQASGTGIPPAFTAGQNNTVSNISGVISVVPTLNGCSGPPATFTITVKPTPTVSHTSVNHCPNVITTALTFTAAPAGSSITWINTTPGINIGLFTANGTTILPSFTAIDPVSSMATNIISLQSVLNGCIGPLTTFSININPNPLASFTNSPACDGAGTTFYDLSTVGSGTITQWGWDMNNDGIYTEATNQNPSYILTPVGYHTVNLMVTTNKGCKDSVPKIVYVNPRPIVNFKGDTLSGCNPLSVNFTDSCSIIAPDQIVKWVWNFGNGTTVTDTTSAMVMTTFTNSLHVSNAYYSVSLTAITNAGCATKLTKNGYITVYPNPLAGFFWDPTDADILDPMIHFHDQSQGANGPNAYSWDFGDVFNSYGDTSSLSNPKHEYSDQLPYTYYATQIVENTYGCKDSVREPVVIHPAVTFYAPNAFTVNFDGLNDGFKGTGIGIDNSTFNLWIFDRWGNELFHSTDLERSWDGKVKGVFVQEDTYVWKATFNDIERKEHAYKGIINLLR